MPNARGEPPPTAGAERTLLAVGSTALFGADLASQDLESWLIRHRFQEL